MRKALTAGLLTLALVALTATIPSALAARGSVTVVAVDGANVGSSLVTVTWTATDIGGGIHKVHVTVQKFGSSFAVIGEKTDEYPSHGWAKTATLSTEVSIPGGLQPGLYQFTVEVYGAGPKPRATAVSDTMSL